MYTIEIDQNLIPLLKKFTTSDGGSVTSDVLTIIQNDALKIELPHEPYKLVANIPYQITSPLLKHIFLESKVHPTSLTLLIQKEVAEKICAQEQRGRLAILVQLFGEPHIAKTIPAAYFFPPPNVTSAILHIRCFPQCTASTQTIERVFELTHCAFGQRRKMLRATIGKISNGMNALAQAHLDPTRRPETLLIDEWITLAQSM